MSEYTPEYKASKHWVVQDGISATVEDDLDRVTALLAGIKGGVYQAVGSALKRAADTGKTAVKKAVTQEYTISQSEFLHQTRNYNHFNRNDSGELSVSFGYAGYVIPLLRFNTTVGNDGRIVTQVKHSNPSETLEHAFSAQMGHHKGIFEREGESRLPVSEFFGPSTPQMMFSNEKVLDEMEAKMTETYEKRIDHEISRISNGWGG